MTPFRVIVSPLVLCAVAVGLLIGPSPAAAQFPNLLEIGGQYMPGADVPDAPPTEAQVASYDASVSVPLPLAKTTYLVLGGAYHADSVSFSMAPDDFIELRAFHSAEVSVLFVQLLPDDWSLSFRLAPGLAGDFRAVDLEMLRVNALAMASYSFSESFVLGGGLLMSYGFGALLPLPAIYLDYRPTPAVRIEAFIPAFANLSWSLGNRIELGARAELQGNEYAVRDRRIRDAYPCAAEPTDDPATEPDERNADADACLDHFAYSVGSAGATLGVRLWDSWWLTMYGGHTFFRRFEPKNAANDTLVGESDDLDNSFLFRATLSWRIPED